MQMRVTIKCNLNNATASLLLQNDLHAVRLSAINDASGQSQSVFGSTRCVLCCTSNIGCVSEEILSSLVGRAKTYPSADCAVRVQRSKPLFISWYRRCAPQSSTFCFTVERFRNKQETWSDRHRDANLSDGMFCSRKTDVQSVQLVSYWSSTFLKWSILFWLPLGVCFASRFLQSYSHPMMHSQIHIQM
jgi:hypothetical protein